MRFTMRLRASSSKLPALLALLGVLLPGLGEANLTMYPTEATVLRGSTLLVNCSDSCGKVGLETTLTKEEMSVGDTWKTFLLSDVQEDGKPMCFSNCRQQAMLSLHITVYWFPESVDLAPLPSWQPVGENLILSCQIKGGAPRSNLTAVLLRGDEVLSRQPVPGDPAELVEVRAEVPVRREDHGAYFSCRTELDLRSRGLELFENSSAPWQLRTFDMPETLPNIMIPELLEVGTVTVVVCTLDELFPVSEAEIYLELGHTRLEPTVTYNKHSISAKAEVPVSKEGVQQLDCTVLLGTEMRQQEKSLTFYSFLAPNLSLSALEVPQGTEVTVACEAQTGALVTLNGGESEISRTQFIFNASAADNGRSFMCSAQLEVAGQRLWKNQTRMLSVLYGPLLDTNDCPRNWTWDEGTDQTLQCQPRGNPKPQLQCLRKGDRAPLHIGDHRPVKEEIQGTYVCEATNSQGVVTAEVVLTVNSKPSNYLPIIITVVVLLTLATVAALAYYMNRQRKIRKYKLQEAQRAEALKLKLADNQC